MARHSRVDVALWGGLVPSSVPDLDALADAGVAGFKAFACPSGWDDFPPVDEAALAAGLAAGARRRLPVAVHCELAALGHSVDSEVAAVRWAAGLSAAAGAWLHVVHTSSAEAVDEARKWPRVSIETCPHYLLLDEASAAAVGPAAHCYPPIRDGEHGDRLWARVRAQGIDTVASDHSPCPPALKEATDPWAGIDSVGLAIPLLISDGRLSLTEIVRLTTAAARLLRLPGKGSLAPGADADLVLVDPAAPWVVAPDTMWSRHRQAPYAGWALSARVVTTLVRGGRVYSADEGPGGARRRAFHSSGGRPHREIEMRSGSLMPADPFGDASANCQCTVLGQGGVCHDWSIDLRVARLRQARSDGDRRRRGRRGTDFLRSARPRSRHWSSSPPRPAAWRR